MKFTDGFEDYRFRVNPSIVTCLEEYNPARHQWFLCQVIEGVLDQPVKEGDKAILVRDLTGQRHYIPIKDRFQRIQKVELTWHYNDGYWGETPEEYGVPYGGPPANVAETHTIYCDEQGNWRLKYYNSRLG